MISIGLRLRFGKSRASDTSACFNAVSVVAIISLFDILEALDQRDDLNSHLERNDETSNKKKNRKKTKRNNPYQQRLIQQVKTSEWEKNVFYIIDLKLHKLFTLTHDNQDIEDYPQQHTSTNI